MLLLPVGRLLFSVFCQSAMPPAIRYDAGGSAVVNEYRVSIYFKLFIMVINSSAFSEAPPTRPPSTSGQEKSSLALAALTLPPYKIEMASATDEPYCLANTLRRYACISC